VDGVGGGGRRVKKLLKITERRSRGGLLVLLVHPVGT